MSLAGKNIIITGATSGIGEGMAATFAKEGASVFIGGRRQEKGKEVAAATGTTFHVVDTADGDSNKAFFEAAAAHFGGPESVDYIFLNAGVEGGLEDSSITSPKVVDNYDFVFGVNVRGVMYGFQYGTEQLRAGGGIVVTSSVASVFPVAIMPVYAASKAAVDSLVRCFAAQFKESDDDRIKSLSVYGVNPAVYGSEMVTRLFKEDSAIEGMAKGFNISGRVGKPSELAQTMVELMQNKLPYNSGDSIAVDGDTHLPLTEYPARHAEAMKERSE